MCVLFWSNLCSSYGYVWFCSLTALFAVGPPVFSHFVLGGRVNGWSCNSYPHPNQKEDDLDNNTLDIWSLIHLGFHVFPFLFGDKIFDEVSIDAPALSQSIIICIRTCICEEGCGFDLIGGDSDLQSCSLQVPTRMDLESEAFPSSGERICR